ncbi:hypothetical protein BDW72DRAFT_183269 [Aspergillus terricola var. indicus]
MTVSPNRLIIGNPAGFNVQFPVFDASTLTRWCLSEDPTEIFPLTATEPNLSWPMADSKPTRPLTFYR